MFNKAVWKVSEQESLTEKQIGLLSKMFLRYSRELSKQLISFLPRKLIVLTGASCSGKSSLAQAMIDQDTSLIHLEVDVVARRVVLEYLREMNSVPFQKLYQQLGEDLAYYVIFYGKNEVFSLRNISAKNDIDETAIKNLQQQILQNDKILYQKITYHLLNKIQANFLYGMNVVLDLVTDNEKLKPFAEFMPLIITMYTPLERLSSYVSQRNRTAKFLNSPLQYRDPKTVSSQFALFFSSRFNANSPCLEKIDAAFNGDRQMTVQTQNESKQIIHNILVDLKIDQKTLSEICLKQPTHLVLNTHEMNVEQSAAIAINFLKNLTCFKKCRTLYGYHLLDNTPPRLILLDGLSVAGKTTTAEAFMAQSPAAILLARSERQRKILSNNMPVELQAENKFDEDIFCFAKYKNNPFFHKLFLEKQAISDEFLSKVALYCEQNIENIFREEENDAADKARQYLNAGVTVLLDNVIFKNNLSAFSGLSPLLVLVYCPFKNLLIHLTLRNQQAANHKPLKWRDPFKIFQVFAYMFGSQDKLNYGEPLEELYKCEVIEVLQKVCEMYPPEAANINKDIFIQDILKKLELDKNESVKIYPQLSLPDFVLNTSNSAQKNGMLLLDYIKKLDGNMLKVGY